MDRNERFLLAAERAKNLKNTPSNEDLAQLYGLYKQATVGDIDIPRPSFFDVRGQTKWDAWNVYKTMPKEKAMELYIRFVNRLEK
jgi:diazepam-binding inhibitor (GABA receptor modulating acyl-CoA-binding protein)